MIISLIIFFYPISQKLYFQYCQVQARKVFEQEVTQKKLRTNTEESIVLPGGIFARLRIPRINLQIYTFEGTSLSILRKGPGHMRGSAYPGEFNNCVILGHDTLAGGPFSHLNQLRKGDLINIDTIQGKFTYSVIQITKVKADDLNLIKPSEEPFLTLTTYNQKVRKERLVVRAKLK